MGAHSTGRPHPLRRHDRQVLPEAPLVDGGELDVGHPAPAVVAEPPGVLDARPPAPLKLDLDRSGRIEATFLNQAYDCHAKSPTY
jgi:hypothetical protein